MSKWSDLSKGKKILTIVGIFVVVIIIAGALSPAEETNNNSQTSQSDDTNSQQEEATASVAKIGEPARDGKFEFTITKVDCSKTTLGTNEFTQTTAQGEYCQLDMTIKNIGDEPQTLYYDDQFVFNADGQKYSADSDAIFALDTAGDIWLEEINPGNQVKGSIVYDVPKGTELVKAELHDSSFSNGVEVDLQ